MKKYGCPECGSRTIDLVLEPKKFKCPICGHEFDEPKEIKDE